MFRFLERFLTRFFPTPTRDRPPPSDPDHIDETVEDLKARQKENVRHNIEELKRIIDEKNAALPKPSSPPPPPSPFKRIPGD